MNKTTTPDEALLMKKALVEIRELRAKLSSLERSGSEPIAVVGMGCRVPGAPNLDAFWDLLSGGVDAITEVPKERWDIEEYYDPDPEKPGKMYTRWGGFLKDIEGFSPEFFGISPREAASMDPQQRLMLEVSWEALEHAAMPVERLQNSQVGVFVGVGATDYSDLGVLRGPDAIDPYNGTGASFSVASGRLSYLLGVRGPSLALDTACSSSLAAVHLAVVSLRSRESDVALAGGVNLIMSPDSLVSLCKSRMLSPDGRCKPFDAGANGYVRGEGCGVLVLKRLKDALADGDHILAVIRGSGVNHNGRSSGLTVPSGPAQQALIRHVLDCAGLKPSEVTYVEAHGTGTTVGDPIEVGALAEVFAQRSRPLLVGSVKSNVGHLEWAAGICGLIKVILSLNHGQIPASLHIKKLNPLLDWESLPLRVVTELTPWPEGKRMAGVSSFGFGGTNAHVLVEAPPGRDEGADSKLPEQPQHLFVLSARSPEALRTLAGSHATMLQSAQPGELADICHTAGAGRSHFEHRLATMVASTGELQQRLQAVAAGDNPAGVCLGQTTGTRSKVAMLFTGQGSQYPGMGRELHETQPVFRQALERCNEILLELLDRPLLEVLYPAKSAGDAARQLIHQTAYTQPALFAVEYALAQCWQSWGMRPHVVMGHSTGEFVAACLAGVFSLEDGLKLIARRAQLMQSLPPRGGMLAVRAPEDFVMRVIAPHRKAVSMAAVNGPRDVVISGDSTALQAIGQQLQAEGAAAQPLTVSHAFHSPLMDPVLAQFEEVARSVRYHPPRLGMISTVTGKPIQAEVVDPAYWVRHIRETVRFTTGMKALQAEDCDAFLEIGPRPTLLGMGRQCVPDSSAAWLPSLRPNRGDWQQMLESLAELYVRGAGIDWSGLERGQRRRKVVLPTYPFERQRYPVPRSNRGSRGANVLTYPLVDTLVQSPLVKETIFATPVSTAVYPYLADHRIFGEVVVPAGCYLAMMLNGARRLGHSACRLEEVFFVAPLVLADKEERILQSVLDQEGSFQIISFAPDGPGGEMVQHVRGRLADSADKERPLGLLEEARKPCTKSVDQETLDAATEGIEFGPSFRWIAALWTGERQSLAQLQLPEAVGKTEGYWLHPGLLDACLQAAGATLRAETPGEVLLPFSVKCLTVFAPAAGSSWWCHARQTGDSVWDIWLLDESGTAIAALAGFEMRKASGAAFQGRRLANWIYRLEWQPQPQRELPARDRTQSWLIVDDAGGLGREIAQHWRGRVVLAVSDDEIDKGLAQSPEAVIYLCGGTDHANPPIEAESASIRLLRLAQTMNLAAVSPRLWLVTLGSQAVTDADAVRLEPAPIWGLGRTLQLEAPVLKCVCVDLPERPTPQDVELLLSELLSPSAETQLAYRSGERFVARLVRHRDGPAPHVNGPFRLQLAEYGSPDQLRLVPLARRRSGPGEVEIEVKAAALNFRDVLIAAGILKDYYAQVLKIDRAQDVRLGFDCAGVIAAVGEGVTDFRVGDEVMTSAPGCFTSCLTLPRTDVVHKPAGLSFESAAALPTAFFTAHYGLCQLARLLPGERVLIHAAAGGVGQAAVQVARAVGAEVFATASPGKWDFLKRQGIAHVMNSRTLGFADEIMRVTGGAGVDVVLNSLTGQAIGKSFDVLRQGGRFVEIGKLGTWSAEQVAQRRPDVSYFTFDLDPAIDQDAGLPHRTLGEVRAWFEAGRLRPLPQRVFLVHEAVEAYRFLQQARQVGKVVLSFAQDGPAIRGDGAYLITGGLGGLGLKTAERLVELGARQLVLVGRSKPSTATQQTIDRLRSAGASVEVVQADVADSAEVGRLVESCRPALRGIVHAAGVLDDGVLEKQTPERFERVLTPKVRGAWNLHTATRDLPLDFFVCFSSMASILGSAGQSNYAVANAFLDALAHHRRALGLPCLTINWGPWAEVGMAAKLSVAGQGVEKIEIADGLQVLSDLLQPSRRWGPAQLGIWRVHWPAFQRRLPPGDPPPLLSAFLRRAAPAGEPVAPTGDFLRHFQAAATEERPALLESAIQKELLTVLGQTAAHQVRPTQPWAELGLDSLMMVDLKNRLEVMTRLTLPVDKLARDVATREVTTQSVASFILQKLDDASATAGTGDNSGAAAAETNGSAAIGAAESDDVIGQLALQVPQLFVIADKQDRRRVLCGGRWRYDFASCNYLGLDLHPEVRAAIPPALAEWGVHPSWTRAVASPRPYDELERELAAFVGAPTTLVFPSISLLHMGVLPLLAGHDGVILKDAEAHHSIHEACLRAQANGTEWAAFPHGDVAQLERKLTRQRPGRTKIIATDGVYSMGSTHPPLLDYARLAKQHNAILYVDDAHGFGIIGEKPDADLPYGYRGNGMVRHFGLDYCSDRIVYVAGLSKSFSSYAAFVTCWDEKVKWDLQAAGPFVFSGPTCVASLASALAGLRVNAREGDVRRRAIFRLTRRFVTAVRALGFEVDNGEYFPIVGVVIGGVESLVRACQLLWKHDILITPAMYPAVPLHRNLVRFSITAENTEEDVDHAVAALKEVRDALAVGGSGPERATAGSATTPREATEQLPALVTIP
jgi:myxalamid-type polyketide synthase MxaB